MNSRTKSTPASQKPNAETSPLSPAARAQLAIRPSVNAAAIIEAVGKPLWGEIDINELIPKLVESLKNVENNDMGTCEAMLFSQANALQTIFTALARRAVSQEYIKQYQTFFLLALKAQNQCRMTLETLALIKNPPVFASQTNIAHGPQQVNNGTAPPGATTAPSLAGNLQNVKNELLETTNGERLDTAASRKAEVTYPQMATVGKIDGAIDRKG